MREDDESEELVRLRSNFYRDNFYRMIKILYFLVFVILLLIGDAFYIIFYMPERDFYATTTDGRIIQLVSCDSAIPLCGLSQNTSANPTN